MKIIQGANAHRGISHPSYEYYIVEGAVAVDEEKAAITLTEEQENEFNKGFKRGILKQLHKNGFLTNEQLNSLLIKRNK